ncbi:uncharacterized protein LOC131180692 [Hevea brasiliensis]|nr:uncharacterized protein LOC131180692 [Hevea brasiliensis]
MSQNQLVYLQLLTLILYIKPRELQLCLVYLATMELSSWCNSGTATTNMDAYVNDRYDPILSSVLESSTASKRPRWRLLWRKIMREKKKFFDCSCASNRMCFSYDPYTYSQNFDQGSTWSDPDNMSRSFSARFAVPSRIFEKTHPLV